MEKQYLISKINGIISNDMSVDIYFVFKQSDTYVQYLADPDELLRAEIITDFSEKLQVYTVASNPYEVTDIYDDNEHEDYHLFFDKIVNNPIATEVFNFDRANALHYTNDIGSLSKIFGFIIDISNGDETISLYKRNQPTNAINPRKVINFLTGTDNKLQLITQNAIYLTKTIDLFIIEDTILINSRNVYESQFGFVAQLKNKAIEGYAELIKIGTFAFKDELGDKIGNFPKGELKKLNNILKDNPIIIKKNWKSIVRQAKQYSGHEFEISSDGTININSQKELKILISILNRDFNINDASKERFLTKNKKLIK